MDKVKGYALAIAYCLICIVALPIIVLSVIGDFVIYGLIKLERAIIEEIDDTELTGMWNELVDAASDGFDSAKEGFSMEMEL